MDNTGNPYASPRSDLTPPPGGGYDTTGPLDPKGRFGRLSWLAWNLVIGLGGSLVVLALMAAGMAVLPQGEPHAGAPILMSLGMLIPQLVIVVLAWLLAIRRFHDIGASGWWTLTLLLPLGNIIAFLVLAIKRGDPGPNRFGPPRPTPDWERVLGIIYIVLAALGVAGVIAALLIPGLMNHSMGVPQG